MTTMSAALALVHTALAGQTNVRTLGAVTPPVAPGGVLVGLPSATVPTTRGAWQCTVPIYVVATSTVDMAGLVTLTESVMQDLAASSLLCTAEPVDLQTDNPPPAYLITVEV